MSRSEERRAAIRQLVLENSIQSQAELRTKLKGAGFRASQPVLSRDLRLLRVAKEAGIYQLREKERVTSLTALASLLRSGRRLPSLRAVRRPQADRLWCGPVGARLAKRAAGRLADRRRSAR